MVEISNLAKKGKVSQVTIPEPYEDVKSLRATAMATKELVEVLAGQRGQAYDVAVTWQDLLDLGWIRMEEIPYDLGSHPFQRPK
jgi:hypothetical protein